VCVCERVRERVRERERVSEWVSASGCIGTCMCLCACSLTNPVWDTLPSAAWLHHIFPQYLINDMIFGRKLFNIKCVFWFALQLLYETFLILRRIQQDIVINVKMSSGKVSFFLDFNKTWVFSTYFQNKLKYQLSSKSLQWEPSCSMRMDRQTGVMKLIVTSWKFSNVHKNETTYHSNSAFQKCKPGPPVVCNASVHLAKVLLMCTTGSTERWTLSCAHIFYLLYICSSRCIIPETLYFILY
jgi:hypothetical protein